MTLLRPKVILILALLAAIDAPAYGTQPPGRPPSLFDAAGNRARPPGHGPDAHSVFPRRPRSRSDRLSGGSRLGLRAAQSALQDCEPTRVDVSSGPALVAYLLSIPDPTCINVLFDESDELVLAAFREENVLYVMDYGARLASTYDSANPGGLAGVFYFARAAFFTEFYRDDITFSLDVFQATVYAIDEFVQNPHFRSTTREHAVVVREVFVLMDSVSHGYRVRYLPVLRNWLADFDSRHVVHWHFNSAANAIMVWLYRGHDDPDFLEVVLSDAELVEVLGELALSDSLLTDPRLDQIDRDQVRLVLENAARELSRFLYYPSAPIAPAVQAAVRRILDRYDLHGEGAGIWLAVVGTVFDAGTCATYDVCDARDEIERTVLSIEHTCSDTVVIRAQSMTPAHLLRACDELSEVDTYFHERLGTDREPLPGDMNATLEVIVYTDWDNYNAYSGFLFGHSTDNGGIYLEGDPSDPANVARFFAHLADWLPDTPVWNLQHEYVHYLDGRFNLAGSFHDYGIFTHKTIWWTEGLAEYISNFGGESPAVTEYLRGQVSSLHEIFDILDFRNQTLYPESHLAMWFMFERHMADIYDFLRFLRVGDYDGYLGHLDGSVGDRYDDDFQRWIQNRTTRGSTTE